MKKIILFLLLLFMCFIASANEDIEFTDEQLNGRWWNSRTEKEKVFFIEGIWVGISLFGEAQLTNSDNVKLSDEFPTEGHLKALKRGAESEHIAFLFAKSLLIPKVTNYETVEKLDEFYKDTFNRNIPVFEAYRFISFQYAKPIIEGEPGFTVGTEEEQIKKLRKQYNK